MTTKRELRKEGFRHVPEFRPLYINRVGDIFDYKNQRFLASQPHNRVMYAGKRLSIPKLILSAFDNQPYIHNRQIRYIDGNTSNLQIRNLCYPVDKSELRINYADLYTAIRCYFSVPKRYKVADRFTTRIYLSEVVAQRCFILHNAEPREIDVFRTYIKNPLLNIAEIASRHALPAVLCREIINAAIKKLIRETLADLAGGKLQVLDFQPRKKTTAQAIREYNERLRAHGLEPIKIRRKKTGAQILKEWNDYIERINSKTAK